MSSKARRESSWGRMNGWGADEQYVKADAPVIAKFAGSDESGYPAGRREALVVESDAWYRDRVLTPCLMAMGFTKVHKAGSISAAAGLLANYRGIGVVITNACLRRGEDGMAVCRMAEDASIPVVMLTSFPLPRNEVASLVDTVVYKKKASVLQTVRAARELAA